jgi:hypothetical protein
MVDWAQRIRDLERKAAEASFADAQVFAAEAECLRHQHQPTRRREGWRHPLLRN